MHNIKARFDSTAEKKVTIPKKAAERYFSVGIFFISVRDMVAPLLWSFWAKQTATVTYFKMKATNWAVLS